MAEELSQAVHRILDKPAPSNFEEVLSEMQAVNIDTEEELIGVVKLVVEKAISVPALSSTCAKMCQALSTREVISAVKSAKTITFRKCLLALCKREFEKVGDGYKDIVIKKKEIEEADNEEEKTQLKESLKELTGRIRRRLHGRMRFIGVLFELKILSARVMHECIERFLSSPENSESLESVCVLLSVVGKELESPETTGQSAPESKLTMNGYFAQLDNILNNKRKATSHALTLLIQKVMLLRKNHWKSESGTLRSHGALEMSHHPIRSPGPLEVMQPLAGPVESQLTDGNNKFDNRVPVRPDYKTPPPNPPAVYHPQKQPRPMSPAVVASSVPPTSQSRFNGSSSRRAMSNAIRIVDPKTNRDVITDEEVPLPVVPVTTATTEADRDHDRDCPTVAGASTSSLSSCRSIDSLPQRSDLGARLRRQHSSTGSSITRPARDGQQSLLGYSDLNFLMNGSSSSHVGLQSNLQDNTSSLESTEL